MAPTYREAEKGEARFWVFSKVSHYMGLHMVNGDKRNMQGKRKGFGELRTNQQRTDEPWGLGKSDGTYRG